MMKIESIVESAMSSWLKEFFMSGFERMMMLKEFPINPHIPESI